MVDHVDGRYICDKCGHTARPGDVTYVCRCLKCLELAPANGQLSGSGMSGPRQGSFAGAGRSDACSNVLDMEMGLELDSAFRLCIRTSLDLDDMVANGIEHQLAQGVDAQFAHNVRAVRVYCLYA
jgi:hypothetical protein